MKMGVSGTTREFQKEKSVVSDKLVHNLHSQLLYFMSKAMAEAPLMSFFISIFGTILCPVFRLQKG